VNAGEQMLEGEPLKRLQYKYEDEPLAEMPGRSGQDHHGSDNIKTLLLW
jgi:hypothetical protein